MKQSGMITAVIKAELAKIRSIPPEKRWEYIWEYYRLAFFGILFGIFFFWMIGTFLVNGIRNTFFPRDSFSMAFAAAGFTDNAQWQEDCLSAIGYDEKQEDFRLLVTAPVRETSDDFRITASVWLANGQPDIFITDEATCRHLLELEALAVFSEAWPENLQQLAADRMADPWRLDISGTALAEAFGLTREPVYLCMYVHGNGFDRALDIVEYILTE